MQGFIRNSYTYLNAALLLNESTEDLEVECTWYRCLVVYVVCMVCGM